MSDFLDFDHLSQPAPAGDGTVVPPGAKAGQEALAAPPLPPTPKQCCSPCGGNKPQKVRMETTQREGIDGLHHRVYINTWVDDFSPLIFALELATPADIIEIDLQASFSLNTLTILNLLSSIAVTQASVITRAGSCATYGALALWLSGKEVLGSRMAMVTLRDDPVFQFGQIKQLENALKTQTAMVDQLLDFIVARRFMTREELNEIRLKRKVVFITGTDLVQRIARVNSKV